MAIGAVSTSQRRWDLMDRGALVLLFVAFALGTPGIGPETRQFSNDAIGIVLSIVFIAPALAALVLSWKLPALAARIGVVGGLLLMAAIVLDLLGLLIGPPPTGMILVDILILAAAAAVAWRCWRLVRG